MKRFFVLLSILVGMFVVYHGIIAFTTTARGESIYLMGMLIPAQNNTLYTYGSIFTIVGTFLLATPLIFRKNWSKRH